MDEAFTRQRGVDFSGIVVKNGSKFKPSAAVLIFVDSHTAEVWFPKSKILRWRFLNSKQDSEAAEFGLNLDDLEEEDEVEVTIPRWLARKEGLLAAEDRTEGVFSGDRVTVRKTAGKRVVQSSRGAANSRRNG